MDMRAKQRLSFSRCRWRFSATPFPLLYGFFELVMPEPATVKNYSSERTFNLYDASCNGGTLTLHSFGGMGECSPGTQLI
jgi:hypothetical protein